MPIGSAAAAALAPTANGGNTEPMFTARSGSSPVASSQRPIQPVCDGASGDAVCQMSMLRKWLWSGFGYPTPRTMASCFFCHSDSHPGHGRVEPELIVQMQHLVRAVGELGTGGVIGRIRIRDKGVEPVVAPVHGEHDEDLRVAGQRFGLGLARQLMPGDPGGAGGQCGSPGDPGSDQELASVHPRHVGLLLTVVVLSWAWSMDFVNGLVNGLDQWTRYSGVLTATAIRVGGLSTTGLSAASDRADQRPTPSR